MCGLVPTRSYSGLTQDGGGVHLHVRTCTPLGGTERRLIELPATRTTNLRSAALPQKRCLPVTEGWLNMETTTIR